MNMSGFRICFAFWLCHWWLGLYGTWLVSHLVLFSAKCFFCWLNWCDLPWPTSPTFMAMLLKFFRPLLDIISAVAIKSGFLFFLPFKVTDLVKYFKISSYSSKLSQGTNSFLLSSTMISPVLSINAQSNHLFLKKNLKNILFTLKQ